MSNFDNTGTVSLWENESDNPKAPKYKGKAYAHRDIRAGEEIQVSLWSNQKANPHAPDYNPKAPRWTGKVEDKFQPNGQSQGVPDVPAPDFDDPIPF